MYRWLCDRKYVMGVLHCPSPAKRVSQDELITERRYPDMLPL